MKKTIIITGTSSGIGFSLAEYFGKQGHRVYGLSRKKADSKLFTSIPTDITEKSQIDRAIEEILSKENHIDILEWAWWEQWKILIKRRL